MLSLSNSSSNIIRNNITEKRENANGAAIRIRAAQPKDFAKLVEWSTVDEDWELGPADFEVWQRCFPPESFLAAVNVDDDLMGFCAGVKHGDNIGFIGMYYVKEEYRGCGVGAILWKTVVKYLEGRNLCLAAVPEMVAKYRDRNSFRIISNWRLRMACGRPRLDAFDLPALETDVRIVESELADPNTITKVVAFDALVAGMNRESWCRNWTLSHKAGKSLIAVTVGADGREDEVVGYGQIHEISGNRIRIGPLYADDEAIARQLIFKLMLQYPDIESRDVRLSFVADDDRTVGIAQDLGLDTSQDYFELRMHTQYEVPFDNRRMFVFSDSDVNFV